MFAAAGATRRRAENGKILLHRCGRGLRDLHIVLEMQEVVGRGEVVVVGRGRGGWIEQGPQTTEGEAPGENRFFFSAEFSKCCIVPLFLFRSFSFCTESNRLFPIFPMQIKVRTWFPHPHLGCIIRQNLRFKGGTIFLGQK